MNELISIFSPQWWTFKNQLCRSSWTAYIKTAIILLLGAGFWTSALHYLTILLTKLQGMESNVGNIIALKGLSLLMMLVFFLLIFSSLLASINNFYLSHDLPVILSSPVSWGSVYLSKWLETAVKSSWMIILAVMPVFIAFGIFYKSPALYYVLLLPVLLTFVFVPAGIGVFISIFLMAVVPAKRAKNIFIILGLVTLVLLFLLFRFLRPERLANPEWFANMTIFLSEMKMSVSIFLPSMWATETLTPFFNTGGGSPIFFALLLMFTVGALVVFGSWLFNAFYYKGLVKAQQAHSSKPFIMEEQFLGKLFLRIISFFLRGSRKALIVKDFISFFRNIGQWSQMLLLFAIIIIYLFSIKALPVEWGTFLSIRLRYIISFLNIGIVGFVITAIASRLVLPSIDNEGPAFWIIRVSPVSMNKFLWSKFLIAFFPLLALAQILIIISNIFLGVKIWFMFLGIITCFLMVASITGLAIGIGAYSASFSEAVKGKEQSGFKGTVYMLLAFAVIAVTIVLEFTPVSGMFLKEISNAALTLKSWIIISLFLLAVIIFNVVVLWMAMRIGRKKLLALQ